MCMIADILDENWYVSSRKTVHIGSEADDGFL